MLFYVVTLTSVFEMSLAQLMFQWGLAFKFKELTDLGEFTVRKGLGLPFPNSGQLLSGL